MKKIKKYKMHNEYSVEGCRSYHYFSSTDSVINNKRVESEINLYDKQEKYSTIHLFALNYFEEIDMGENIELKLRK